MRPSLAFAAFALTLVLAAPARAQDRTVNVPLGSEPSEAAPAPSKAPVDVVRRFYDAFEKGDFATLESLYAPNVHWQDTIFNYDGRENVMGVWRFEVDPKKGGKITYKILSSEGDKVVVSWSDDYSFFGNPVNHAITATLTVKDGQIVDHREDYSWDEWAKQAFAFKNLDLGNFATTKVGKVVMEGALRAFLYSYVPAMNALAAVQKFVATERDRIMGSQPKPQAEETGPRNGISELLDRRVSERAGESTRPGPEGR